MALIIKDRVKEITTTTGTGDVSLGGASATFDAFQSVMSNGDTTFYAIVHTASGTDEWEVGVGTWNTGNTLTRTTVYAGSNGTSAVNFSSGNKDIFMTYPASKAAVAGEDVTFADVTATDITATGTVTLAGDPTSALQAATKEYVDTIAAAGIHYHTPVRVEAPSALTATYDNGTSGVGATLTNSGTQAALVIDGVTLSTSDRVLVYNQTNAAHNGVYTVTNTGSASTNWVLTRATDADSYGASDPDAMGEGDAYFVKEGDTGAGELYVMNTSGVITFGTTNITFTVIAETAVYSAGTGLTLTGTTFSTNQDISTSASPTFAGATVNGDITVTGTVDGRDVATDGSKLDNIEAGATADQTAAEIKTAYESNSNTNAFTDAEQNKLSGIETGATGDQTASEILTAIKTVDGATSGLDADLLDGQQGSYYLNTSTTFSGDVSGTYNNIVVANDSHTHDGRYYTETEADSRFANVTGDTFTGDVTIDSASAWNAGNGMLNVGGTGDGRLQVRHIWGKSSGSAGTDDLWLQYSNAGQHVQIGASGGGNNLYVSGELYAQGYFGGQRVFHDNYHPNADKWTTARTLTLSGDASGSVSWDGSANASLSVTVANDSHTHDGRYYTESEADSRFLNVTGDTMTGRLVLPDAGYSIGNEYHTWKRSYVVNNTSPKELLYHDGNSLPNGGAYRFHAHIDGTGTDQSATAVYWNQNGTWKVNVTYQSGTSSNHPEFIIGGSPEKPQIHIDHSSNYTIQVLAERLELTEGTGTDNLAGFGADAFLGSVNGTLRYNNAGSANNYANGNTVWHAGNDGSGSGLNADLLDGYHLSTTRNSANTVPVRDGNGYLHLGWINTTSGATTNTIDKIYASNDSYIRYVTPATFRSQITDGSYVNVTGDTMSGGLLFSSSATSGASNSTPTALTYGNLSGYGTFYINADTDGSTTEYLYLTAGYARGSTNGLRIGYALNSLTWQGNTVWHAGNDGSGSGLDADLLDGQHASAFAPAGGSYSTDWTADDLYYDAWIRNNGTGESGLYWHNSSNPGYAWHIYPQSRQDMTFRTGTGNGGIKGTVADATARGYVHWTTSNEIGFLNNSRSWSLRVDSSGNSFHTSSARAPIFYDSANTSYYVDPASTSVLNRLTMTGSWAQITINSNSGDASIAYNSTDYSKMFTAGSGAGAAEGDEWAIAVYSTNQSTHYQTPFRVNGETGYVMIGDQDHPSYRLHVLGTGYSNTDFRAPIFYDSNNTGYYVDPASTSNLNALNVGGNAVLTTASTVGNADTVDSLHASSFIRSDTFDNVNANTNWPDNRVISVGTAQDCEIYFDGTDARIEWNTSNLGSIMIGETNFSTFDPVIEAYMDYNNPYAILYRGGDEKLRTVSTGIDVTGDVNSTSDIRYKKNIKTIDDALSKVQALKGVTFDWDNDAFASNRNGKKPDFTQRATGVIAQDVEKVLPEAVREKDDGFKNVAYGNMVGLLVEAIKEQQKQIDDLKAQIAKGT